MFKQVLSTSTRALRSSTRAYVPSAAVRTQFSPAPINFARSQLQSSRWYSDSTEAKKEGDDAKPATDAEAPASPEEELKKKLEAKEKEAIDWKDKYLRSVADFRNLQDRATRDQKNARNFAIQGFAKDLVDSVDNLDRALTMGQDKIKALEASDKKNEDLTSFYEGVKMTEGIMLSTLTKHGLERFDPQNEKFNPNEHEATFMTPQPDKEDGTVFFVQQKGFKLNGRVLRAAKVGVVKNA
ncbi:Mitochondrial matrix cochaperone [Neopestalotiopsis sp. 37M]|nr:Mitochondrial matrix cochaperone [Neopestalotiopsis sp. 37M]